MRQWNAGPRYQYSQLMILARNYFDENPEELITITSEKSKLKSPGNYAEYVDEFEIECNNIKPYVSGPDHIDIVHSVDELGKCRN